MTKLNLKVTKTSQPADRIASITLESADGAALPGYEAGAHLRFDLPGGDNRPYSLISTGEDMDNPAAYRVGVRLEEDSKGGSSFMHSLKEGVAVSASEPVCDFHLVDAANYLLIAGGIGVTPIAAMATKLKADGKDYVFHYSGRSEGSLAFVPELSDQHGDRLQLHYDDADSCLNLETLIKATDTQTQIFVCGPRGMIEAAREIAVSNGFDKDHIHFELFASDAADAKDGDQPFDVVISSTGDRYTIPAGKTIVEVLEEADVDIMYDCQRGDCGVCQVDVLEGIPDHRDVILTDDERAANDVMQICVSRAKTDILVLDL